MAANVTFTDDATLTGTFDVDGQTLTLNSGANLSTSGTGTVDFDATQNIVLNSGSSLTTTQGSLALDANATASPVRSTVLA